MGSRIYLELTRMRVPPSGGKPVGGKRKTGKIELSAEALRSCHTPIFPLQTEKDDKNPGDRWDNIIPGDNKFQLVNCTCQDAAAWIFP